MARLCTRLAQVVVNPFPNHAFHGFEWPPYPAIWPIFVHIGFAEHVYVPVCVGICVCVRLCSVPVRFMIPEITHSRHEKNCPSSIFHNKYIPHPVSKPRLSRSYNVNHNDFLENEICFVYFQYVPGIQMMFVTMLILTCWSIFVFDYYFVRFAHVAILDAAYK